MKSIPLTRGKFALVDDEDFEELSKYSWQATKSKHSKNFRATRRTPGGRFDKRYYVAMHRMVLNINDSKIQIDHIDRDPLNNQKSNLRICTNSQNQQNRKKQLKCSSKYKGVSLDKRRRKWYSYIRTEKLKSLGYFHSEIEAAKAYNEAAKKYFGEFALLNDV